MAPNKEVTYIRCDFDILLLLAYGVEVSEYDTLPFAVLISVKVSERNPADPISQDSIFFT